MVAPDLVEQLAAAVDPLGVGHEEVQESELSGPEFECLAIAQHPVGLGIELETTDIHCMVGQGGNASAKHGLDTGLQLLGREGLGHVIIGPALKPFDFVGLFGACGEHDDGHVFGLLIRAQPFGKLHPA